MARACGDLDGYANLDAAAAPHGRPGAARQRDPERARRASGYAPGAATEDQWTTAGATPSLPGPPVIFVVANAAGEDVIT